MMWRGRLECNVSKSDGLWKNHRFFDLRLTNLPLKLGIEHPHFQTRVQNAGRTMYNSCLPNPTHHPLPGLGLDAHNVIYYIGSAQP